MTGGIEITLPGEEPLPIATLSSAHESWLPDYMAGPAEAEPEPEPEAA
jgi:hypothetical protein